jgi:hypothetical protein
MDFMGKIAKKFVKSATIVVSDSMKTEVKNVASNALPTLLGIGFAIAGLVIFKSALTKTPKVASIIPSLSNVSIITNNWFLGEDLKAEILAQIIGSQGRKGI